MQNRRLAAVLLIGLLLRLGMAARHWSVPIEGDATQYADIAKNIVTRGEFALEAGKPTASRPPLYPAFLTLFAPPSSDAWPHARLAQTFLDTGTIWLIYLFGLYALRNDGLALAGAAAYAAHPVFIAYSVQILTEVLFLLGWMATLGLLLRALESAPEARRDGPAVLAGVVTGLTILARPNFMFFPPGAAVMLAAFHWRRPAILRRLCIVLAFMGLTLLPWSMRNRKVLGGWIPVATGGGASLWSGAQVPIPYDIPAFQRQIDVGRTEIEADAEFYRMAKEDYRKGWRIIAADLPSRFLHFWLTSHSALFGSTEPLSVYRRQGRWGPVLTRVALWALHLAVLGLGLWGVWSARRDWNMACTLTIAAFGYYSLHLFTGYWTARYHLPALALLTVFAGASCVRIASAIRTGKS